MSPGGFSKGGLCSEIVLCAQFSRYTWMNTRERKAKAAKLSRGRNPGGLPA